MRLGWAVTTDHFPPRAPDARQHEGCEPGPNLLCMGLFSRFCVRALRCIAHSVSKTRVNALAEALRCVRDTRSLDSSLRDVKQDDSNNEVAPSRSGEQIDDVLDGVVGAVVGGFESAVWAMVRGRTAGEAAGGKWSAQLFVEEQK